MKNKATIINSSKFENNTLGVTIYHLESTLHVFSIKEFVTTRQDGTERDGTERDGSKTLFNYSTWLARALPGVDDKIISNVVLPPSFTVLARKGFAMVGEKSKAAFFEYSEDTPGGRNGNEEGRRRKEKEEGG